MPQVICWVLGEYGTADGKHSAAYIIGKLCDVAEAHPEDDTVKVLTIDFVIFGFQHGNCLYGIPKKNCFGPLSMLNF